MATQLQKRDDNNVERATDRPSVRPAVDIYENKDEYLLVADIPGVSKENLSIHIDAERITLEGKVSTEGDQEPVQREFRLADYVRSFEVPESIDREKVSAQLKQGVLWLHLPKVEAVKPRQIQVQAG